MRGRSRLFIFVAAGLAVGAGGQHANRLKPPNAMLDEEFEALMTVRELSNGVVLLADARVNRIVAADFTSQKVELISRNGSGPLEYRVAFPIFPLGGDSSLMTDGTAHRWLFFNGTKVVGALPPDSPEASYDALGTDERGFVLALQYPRGDDEGDSNYVVRFKRKSARVDTIARILGPRQPAPDELAELFMSCEQARLAADGWVAIVRTNPYRVDWREPSGKWISGKPIPAAAVKISSREKAAFTRRTGQTPAKWPAQLPPVNCSGYPPLVTFNGEVVVRRGLTADHPNPRYDVIDHRGKLLRQIELPANEFILGFGRRSAYVVVFDDNDIMRLRRHPWP